MAADLRTAIASHEEESVVFQGCVLPGAVCRIMDYWMGHRAIARKHGVYAGTVSIRETAIRAQTVRGHSIGYFTPLQVAPSLTSWMERVLGCLSLSERESCEYAMAPYE